mgnify:CR=1 FL=1
MCIRDSYWIVGGIPKSGDKFLMSKKECYNFKAYIFGKNKNYFIKKMDQTDHRKGNIFPTSLAIKEFEDWSKIFNKLYQKAFK